MSSSIFSLSFPKKASFYESIVSQIFHVFFAIDDDLITIADATDFAHAREYSSTGVVKVVIYGKY